MLLKLVKALLEVISEPTVSFIREKIRETPTLDWQKPHCMVQDPLPTPGICLKHTWICCLLSKDFWEVRGKEISPYKELVALEISGLRGPLEFAGAEVPMGSRDSS